MSETTQMEFEQQEFKANPLADLMKLVEHMRQLEAERNELAMQLETKDKYINDLVLQHIPNAMQNLNLEEITLNNGVVLRIREEIFANISEARREAAHKWLRDHGAAALIKEQMTIEGNERRRCLAPRCRLISSWG